MKLAALLWACACLLGSAGTVGAQPAPKQPAAKVLKYAFQAAETGFDPAQISDLYSSIVLAHVFEAPYRYDYLARPFKVVPNTAAGMPQVSADFKTWTVRLQLGIHFADDPAFGGKPRELVAQDYVYAIKRIFDPALKSPRYSNLNDQTIIGLDALRSAALANKAPFDYDREVDGLRAIDRYTLQIRLESPRPRLLYELANSAVVGAVAREVIEAYPGKAMEHPVGTGPFRLIEWRRSSRMVLERNPSFRTQLYDATPNADDAEGRALLARFKGRRLPMVDRVELGVIEEAQPRWLSFLNAEFDWVLVPIEFANLASPNGALAPNLARRGVQQYRVLNTDRTYFYFNMDDAVVGGYTPDKVALRRAISLATNLDREINIVRRGQAIPAQSVIAPGTYGYDPAYKSENSEFDAARAKALLEVYGYTDRDGDGWREQPDGTPLVIRYATSPDSTLRQFDELWKKNLSAIGVRTEIEAARWPEQLKRARAGQLMVWMLGDSGTRPDSQEGFSFAYGPGAGGQNLARFKLAAYDALYERLQALPDGPERLALIRDANRLLTAYMPLKFNVHRILTDLAQPWLIGFRRPLFGNQWWQYVDIDDSLRRAR